MAQNIRALSTEDVNRLMSFLYVCKSDCEKEQRSISPNFPADQTAQKAQRTAGKMDMVEKFEKELHRLINNG